MHGARACMVEMKEHKVNDEAAWRLVRNSSEIKVQVSGLERGVYYAFRVRAVLAAGVTPYSQSVQGMAA